MKKAALFTTFLAVLASLMVLFFHAATFVAAGPEETVCKGKPKCEKLSLVEPVKGLDGEVRYYRQWCICENNHSYYDDEVVR